MDRLYKTTITGREIYLGEIDDYIYYRKVTNKHLYQYTDPSTKERLRGWTVDKDAYQQSIKNHCRYLKIHNTEEQKSYEVSIDIFGSNAIQLRDRYFLALKHWKRTDEITAFKKIKVFTK